MSSDPRDRRLKLVGSIRLGRSGVTHLRMFPQHLHTMVPAIVRRAQSTLVVAHVSYLAMGKSTPGAHAERRLQRLARVNHVHCAAGPSQAIIAIDRGDIYALLDGISHWSFRCWDASRVPHPSEFSAQEAITASYEASVDAPALDLLDGAQLFVSSHDDDDFILEARDASLVQDAFSRGVGALVGELASAVQGRGRKVVAPLPAAAVEHIWSSCPAFELQVALAPGKTSRVQVEFGLHRPSPIWWSSSEEFEPVGELDYDIQHDAWSYPHH